MNKIYLIVGILIIAPTLFFAFLGYQSQQGSAPGLANNQLNLCPDTPNCVCSESKIAQDHFIEPLAKIQLSSTKALEKARQVIIEMGGTIVDQQAGYLSATFTSSLFRYVDDFEVRFDEQQQSLHFRSASRVGKSDFGINAKRVAAFKQHFRG